MTDCIIIGGGPAGLSAAINLRQRGRSCLVLTGGPGALQKAALVDNCAGLPGLSGPQLLETLTAHARAKGAQLRTARVSNILPFGDRFMVNADGEILECRAVVLACGAARSAEIAGEDAFLGRGVSYCATCDGMLYRQRRCVVWGLSDTAPQEAAYLTGIGVEVTYVAARRPDTLPESIPFVAGALKEIDGGDTVRQALLSDGQVLPCDGVFILRTAIAPARLLEGLALQDGCVAVDRRMATNFPGVFAAGDCTGAPLQVSKALGEGQIAGLAAAEYCAVAEQQAKR